MQILDTENADRNLTSSVTVLTHTPSTTLATLCQCLIYLGDGSKNLTGEGGIFQVVITIGGQTLQPSPQSITFSTATRATIFTMAFPVPLNTSVVVNVLSPNSGDTDVDVTAVLYAIGLNETATGNLNKSAGAIVTGTVTTGGTTTSIPTSALSPSGTALDQFKGRIMIFLRDTTTAGLQAQATDITGNTASATPTFTVTALSTAPASGDTFIIV